MRSQCSECTMDMMFILHILLSIQHISSTLQYHEDGASMIDVMSYSHVRRGEDHDPSNGIAESVELC